ncbi:MAG: RraA family protein [Verrucomicrobia bacterium]|jgi:4-hydroxy-4-methyl-2-oxoglutarate aldolase|nr:RraA family protein [Verrucomicrobiota bacterium]MBV9272473.1 RraA family protein [Verrucomicrobiota bacterium]
MTGDTSNWQRLSKRLERCYGGAVYDVMRDLGIKNCVLPPAIRALDLETQAAGRIWTMEGRPDPGISIHESILRWTEFLSTAPAEHVIVCQPHDHSLAIMGELSAETLQFRGVKGYIVDGGCRDNAFIRKRGFPVFARFQTPRDIAGAWTCETFGEPIEIEGVKIRTGDFVLADIDGIVMIPEEQADEVISKVEEVMKTENLVRTAILEGVSPKEAYLRYRKF